MNRFTVRRAFRCPLAPEWGRGGTLALAAAHQRANLRQSDALASRVAGAFSASA
jgi:hypothetical protein